jgi:hypothetical protein
VGVSTDADGGATSASAQIVPDLLDLGCRSRVRRLVVLVLVVGAVDELGEPLGDHFVCVVEWLQAAGLHHDLEWSPKIDVVGHA